MYELILEMKMFIKRTVFEKEIYKNQKKSILQATRVHEHPLQ